MEDIALMRQTEHPAGKKSIETHLHPYDDFPEISSHIHPKFAIMGFSHNVETMSAPTLRNLCKTIPIVKKVLTLSACWRRMLPCNSILEADSTYVDPGVIDNSDDSDDAEGCDSDGDSISTVPRRLIFIPPPAPKRQRVPEDDDDESNDGRPLSKSRRMGEPDNSDGMEENAWTTDRISEWVREVSKTPPPEADRAGRAEMR
jgi:hypothetical protein